MIKNGDKLKIGISIGDINGIGPEVIIKTLADNRVWENVTPVIYGSGKTISFYRKAMELELNYFQTKNVESIHPHKINIVNVWEEVVDIQPGQLSEQGGIYAKKSLEAALNDLAEKKIHALVTAPIHKKNIASAGFNFPGHTEFLASRFDSKHLMIMKSEDMAVATATGHIPIGEVPGTITAELIESKLNIMHQCLKNDFGIAKPRIAVLGLNPHAGEDGMIGREEEEIIRPVVQNSRNHNMLVYGPYPADGFFGALHHTKFDGVLSMYHDQGLIAFKIFGFETGVNVTAGLPVIRTSPDHGTAFDIAGKYVANEASFRSAFFMARDIARQRFPAFQHDEE